MSLDVTNKPCITEKLTFARRNNKLIMYKAMLSSTRSVVERCTVYRPCSPTVKGHRGGLSLGDPSWVSHGAAIRPQPGHRCRAPVPALPTAITARCKASEHAHSPLRLLEESAGAACWASSSEPNHRPPTETVRLKAHLIQCNPTALQPSTRLRQPWTQECI